MIFLTLDTRWLPPVVLAVSGIAVTLTALPALAQQAAPALEEVLVTARKREVDIQDAPVAVSVLSGLDFDRANLVRLDNFNGYAPGLTIAKNDGAGRVVAIRGVGWETAQNLGTQPSVLVYVDGIYLANPLAMGLDLGEVERIDVYRGPQGTEFGQGTTGGAIDIITRKPAFDDFNAAVEFSYGTFDHLRARASVNLPISDTLALRGAVQKYNRDGFAEIQGGALDGYDLDDADSVTGNLSLRWEPVASLSVLLSGFVQDSDQHAAAQKNILDPNQDARELSQDFAGIFALENASVSATIEWESPWGVVLKSLTGWQKLEKEQSVDGDRLNESLISIDVNGLGIFGVPPNNWDVLPFWDNDSDSVSQEINLTFRGEQLDWVVGAYYLHYENFNHFLEANGPAPFSAFEDAVVNNPSVVTLPPFASVLSFVEARTLTRDDYAFYGQATWRFNDRFAVTAGGRHQQEDQLDESVQFFGIFPVPDLETEDSEFTWKAGLDVNLTEDNLLYLLVSTGFKNGGTNPGALRGGAIFLPVRFKPETVTAWEVGSKNLFFDDRVRLNVTGFFYDYDNLQFMQEDPVPFAGGTGNIPETEIYGVETEFTWAIAEGWQLDGLLTWMDGEFKQDYFAMDVVDFREALAPGVGLFTPAGFATRMALATSTNIRGNEPPKLVDLGARLGLVNRHAFADGAVLTSRVEYVHRGEYQYRVWNNPLVDTVPDYDSVNLHFQYGFAKWPLGIALGVTNLFDEDGVNSRFSNPFGVLQTSEEFIPPREIIGTVRYEF